jgi:GNAT superfamily N-acetyltransferase/uncharacterized glyoxalase superfamily protein PhnB
MEASACEPILPVRDVRRTIAYWRDVLGFDRAWMYLDPPVHAGISLGKAQVQFTLDPARAERWAGMELFFRVADPRASEREHRERGATFATPLEDKPWGMAEYSLRDPDGYVLRFAGNPLHVQPADAVGELPSHYRIEVRTPSVDDFGRLHDAVGWCRPEHPALLGEALARSAFCVCATDDRSGETVGMLRVVGDGKQFTIWDVMVRPDDQGKLVGSELMRTAIAHLRTLAPTGTFVGLFSGKPAFYERLGFQNDGGLHRPL